LLRIYATDANSVLQRASRQYIEGLTVAQTEYDRELKSRRDAEAEVTRLRVLLSGQAARLTTLIGDTKRKELKQQMTNDLRDNLSGLELDLSKLKAERDMTLAEVEELAASKRYVFSHILGSLGLTSRSQFYLRAVSKSKPQFDQTTGEFEKPIPQGPRSAHPTTRGISKRSHGTQGFPRCLFGRDHCPKCTE